MSFHTYPDVGHGFARPGTTGAEAQAAELANRRTVDFLNLNLR
jgi:carboxymethylenebutenolidase